MATKSILKTIFIKDKKAGKSLVTALVTAVEGREAGNKISVECTDIRGDNLRKFFNK